ncbi:hypothetical protein CONLIGDRAFT_639752 [Coniochaeta ligniaria NRRL 30616]|uniref:Mid2 domain-containing protein n=1 Tax=Coniochaeta ligniaria NRRL 30616 TaxID=1408157 RepID=A0A1J7J7Q6_9PEZI|nr:hypothetical protein CONLIGDRAFT_639752 [Coniochaeta ligniaria NRRL 30616]
MRLSPSTVLWLAAASSVGTVKGEDSITFRDSDFTVGGVDNAAVFQVAIYDTQTHQFHWNANQSVAVTIKAVNLRAFSGIVDGTLAGTLVGTFSTTTGTEPVSTTTPTTTVGPPGPQTTHLQEMKAHGIVPITPILGGDWQSGREKRSGEPVSTGSVPLPGIITSKSTTHPIESDPVPSSPSPVVEDLPGLSGGSSGTVYITNLTQLGESEFAGKKLWLELLWDAPDGQHTVYSRAFAVTTATKNDGATIAGSDSAYYKTAPVKNETIISPTTTTPSASATSTTAPSASASALSPMGGSGSAPGSHSASGLSTGAIAGIAVAAALIGLALLAVLIFCLVRRNRRQRRNAPLAKTDLSQGGYGNGIATPDLVAQKEADAAGVDGVAPHSPYSDDGVPVVAGGGGQRGMSLRRGSAAAVAAARHEEMPLARAVSGREVVGVGDDREGSARGSSSLADRETPTAVRHLVEEGMTADEIRRLEEEERELDQAIEQAGGGRR